MSSVAPDPALPRYVEQLRIVLWMQTHLTLIGLLIQLIWFGAVVNDSGFYIEPEVRGRIMVVLVVLAASAAVLAVCAKLAARRWWWVYLLSVASELNVALNIVRLWETGITVMVLALLNAVLCVWALVNLSRREVRSFMLRLGVE